MCLYLLNVILHTLDQQLKIEQTCAVAFLCLHRIKLETEPVFEKKKKSKKKQMRNDKYQHLLAHDARSNEARH